MNNNIEKLWEYACSGDIISLSDSLNENNLNERYYRFGKEHSLIMGAFRNNEFETVKYLINIGETVTDEERKEIKNEVERIEIMKKIVGI